MSTPLESIVRPFSDPNVFPVRFTKPGTHGVGVVRVAIGFQGSVKTMGYSFSASLSTKMGQTHREGAPSGSASLTTRMSQAAGG